MPLTEFRGTTEITLGEYRQHKNRVDSLKQNTKYLVTSIYKYRRSGKGGPYWCYLLEIGGRKYRGNKYVREMLETTPPVDHLYIQTGERARFKEELRKKQLQITAI